MSRSATSMINVWKHVLFINSYEFKSSGLIAYSQGNLGGAMAVSAARPFLSELGCLPVKQFVTIPFVSLSVIRNELLKIVNCVNFYHF